MLQLVLLALPLAAFERKTLAKALQIWRFKSPVMGLSNLWHGVASNASADFNWLA